MKHREIVFTEDGSHSLYVPELNEHYHSVHGAWQESSHIFIQNGIATCESDIPHILEAGFGTGLNAYLTLIHALENKKLIVYHTFEKYPLTATEISALNYPTLKDMGDLFLRLHEAPWEQEVEICPGFRLHKHQADFSEVNFPPQFDLIFYDAFAPDVQPRLWSKEILSKFCKALAPQGIFVTYCVKGSVKQTLRDLGLTVKRLPGPPGKREMLRATKSHITSQYLPKS